MTNFFKDLVTSPWIEAIAAIPILVTLVVIGALQALDTPDGVLWTHRLWRVSAWLAGPFVVVVAARFILLST